MCKKQLHIVTRGLLVFFLMSACSITSLISNVSPGGPGTPSVLTGAETEVAGTVVAAVGPTATEMSATKPTAITPNNICTNAYYPHSTGSDWSYSSSGGELGNYTYQRTVTAQSASGFTTQFSASNGVKFSFDWRCQDGNLAALDAGAGSFTMTTTQIKMTSDSVTADGYDIPASFDPGKSWAENVTVDGSVSNNTGKTVKSQVVSHLTCASAGTDSISVPAGKFDTVKANCTRQVIVSSLAQGKSVQLAANTENIIYWYAKGVGYVKSVATGGSNNETVVLTDYKIK